MNQKSDNLSPARETVLALLLGRMSDPNQLVELVYRKRSQSKTKTPLNNDANAAEVNPFIVPSPKSAQSVPSLTRGNASIGGTGVSSAAAAAAVPAPSAIELQSLLLAVATAEGVSKIQALRKRGDGSGGAGDGPEGAESGGKGDGAAERGVRGAAMEMLERLTNQLISTCVVAHVIVALGCPYDPRQALNGKRVFVRFRLGTVACSFRFRIGTKLRRTLPLHEGGLPVTSVVKRV